MPVYRFPSVDADKAQQLETIGEQLITNYDDLPDDVRAKIEAVATHILNACQCAYIQLLINSSEIRALAPVDPVVVRQLEDILRTCK